MTRRASADLWLLGALLATTAVFGRDFFAIEVPGTPAYATDAALAVLVVLVVARLGVRGAAERLSRLPLVPLLVYWVAGAVAVVRGLATYGFDLTKQDAGLVLYSLFLPVAALIASDARRLQVIFRVLMWASAAAGALGLAYYVAFTAFDSTLAVGPDAGIYATAFPAWVFARLVLGQRVSAFEAVAAAIALLSVGVGAQRSTWLGMALAFVLIAVLVATVVSPRQRVRIAAVSLAGAACAAAGTVALEVAIKGDARDLQVEREIVGAASPTASESPEGSNVQWRLDFWEYSLARAARAPIAGEGFGVPMTFEWGDRLYDTRLPLAAGGIDETGPHNEFVHVAFRMGLFAGAALVVLFAIGFGRGTRVVRSGEIGADDRAMILALIGLLAAGCSTVGFNDALKGPFIAIYVWTPLALLLVAPSVLTGSAARPGSPSPESGRPPSA